MVESNNLMYRIKSNNKREIDRTCMLTHITDCVAGDKSNYPKLLNSKTGLQYVYDKLYDLKKNLCNRARQAYYRHQEVF